VSLQGYAGAIQRRRGLSDEAVSLARGVGDPRTLMLTLNAAYMAVWSPTTLELRQQLVAEEHALATQLGDPQLIVLAHLDRIPIALEIGDMEAFSAEIDALARYARQLRHPWYLRYEALFRAVHALTVGRFDKVEALTQEMVVFGT